MKNTQRVDLVFRWMLKTYHEHIDSQTGALNTTRLAEDACDALDLWFDDGGGRGCIPVALFEAAFAIDEMHVKAKTQPEALAYAHVYGDFSDAWDRECW